MVAADQREERLGQKPEEKPGEALAILEAFAPVVERAAMADQPEQEWLEAILALEPLDRVPAETELVAGHIERSAETSASMDCHRTANHKVLRIVGDDSLLLLRHSPCHSLVHHGYSCGHCPLHCYCILCLLHILAC